MPEDFSPERVLVLRPRGLGDVVLASAVVGALRRRYPEARLHFLSEAPSRSLLETDPRLDRIFLLGRRRGNASGRISTGDPLAAVAWVRDVRADLVVDLFSNPFTAIVTAVSGAPYRIGLDKRLRRFAYNVRVPRFRGRPEDDHRYAREVQLDFLRASGIAWQGECRAQVFLTDADHAAAREFLRVAGTSEGGFGVVLPGGSWESKRWSVGGFVEAGRALAGRFDAPTVVAWGPPERGDAEAIARQLGSAGLLAPPSTLREMAALLGRAGALVSTDCLGRHLAIVQGVPTVGVFGSTDPRDWTPPDGPHRAVAAPKTTRSLRDLPAAPVIREIHALFAEIPGLDATRDAL